MGSEPGAASFDSKIAGRCLAFPVSVPTVGLSELKGADRHHACVAHGPLPTRRDTASLSQQASVARKPLSPPLRTPETKRRLPGHITSASRGVGPAPEAGVTARVTGECSLYGGGVSEGVAGRRDVSPGVLCKRGRGRKSRRHSSHPPVGKLPRNSSLKGLWARRPSWEV